jgi:hypothetical protein
MTRLPLDVVRKIVNDVIAAPTASVADSVVAEHVLRLVESRNELLAELKVAAPEFCSAKCPSYFPKGLEDSPRHIPACNAIREAIAKAESGR